LSGRNPSGRDGAGRRWGRLRIDGQLSHDNGRTRDSLRRESRAPGTRSPPAYLLGLAWGR
jgi:hypothetical protein